MIQGTDAVIAAAHDGTDIRVEARASIFKRFTCLEQDRARSGSSGGTGLGLLIAREIATGHRGEIRVSDRLEGRPGVVFSVRLPLPETATDRSGRGGHRLVRGKQQRDPGLGGAAPNQQ
jgi:two-component system sensor histidine kinase SenX3